jgi:hypothetical protein
MILALNVCKTCTCQIELTTGIGWLHLDLSPSGLTACDAPRPRYFLCWHCGATVPAAFGCAVGLHTDALTSLPCLGSLSAGLRPPDEASAWK